jgi:pyridoxine 5-phosphate synthase
VELLRETVKTRLNLEMAATEEMIRFARENQAGYRDLVPEFLGNSQHRAGWTCVRNYDIGPLRLPRNSKPAGIAVSLFIDPEKQQIEAAQRIAAPDH